MGGENEQETAAMRILAAVREELGGVGAAQQRLGDDLAAILASGDLSRGIVRLQDFDRLRQRVDLLDTALYELSVGGADIGERLLARMTVAEVRSVFARHLGQDVAATDAAGDVELF